jgi:signal transduction histidine kinase
MVRFMRRLLQQVASGDFGSKLDPWIIRVLTRPSVSRLTCALIVAAYVVTIGLVDYLSGTAISLQVFYLAPIALALAWLGFFAAFLTAVCSIIARVGGDWLLGAEYTRRPSIIWNCLGFLATYLIVVWILQAFITLRRELEDRVRSRTDALAREVIAREQLQQELIEISERERRSIGNDLNEGLGQHLTALTFATEVLNQQLAANNPRAADTAREIGRLAEEGVRQSRQLGRGLLLSAIEPAGLTLELEELAASIQRQTGVRCHCEAVEPPLVYDSSTASHLFRIAQEAVRNSIRHAKPTALHLSLRGEDRDLVLAISDNGTPLAPAKTGEDPHAALRAMAHRARLIGAHFSLESKPGHGTRVSCRVPLTAPPVLT